MTDETTVELQWFEHRWLIYYGQFKIPLESLKTIIKAPKNHLVMIKSGVSFLSCKVFYSTKVCYLYSIHRQNEMIGI